MTACGVSRGGAGPTKKKRLSTDHLLYLLKLLAFSVFVHTHREREKETREFWGWPTPSGILYSRQKGGGVSVTRERVPVCLHNK
jgi:hypothetical protein